MESLEPPATATLCVPGMTVPTENLLYNAKMRLLGDFKN